MVLFISNHLLNLLLIIFVYILQGIDINVIGLKLKGSRESLLLFGIGLIKLFNQSSGTSPFSKENFIILYNKSIQQSFRDTSGGIPSHPIALPSFISYTDCRTSSLVIGAFNEEQSGFGNIVLS
jgi:hypothetical protein